MPEVIFPDRPAEEPIYLTAAQQAAWKTNHPETVVGEPECTWERELRFHDLWDSEGV